MKKIDNKVKISGRYWLIGIPVCLALSGTTTLAQNKQLPSNLPLEELVQLGINAVNKGQLSTVEIAESAQKIRELEWLDIAQLTNNNQIIEKSAQTLENNNNDLRLLTQQSLINELLIKNAQIIYSKMQLSIADAQVDFEKAFYEPELYTNLRYDNTFVPNTATEKLSRQNQSVYKENNTSLDFGVRNILATGAEVKVGYKINKRENNIIPLAATPINSEDTENSSSLSLVLSQPLLRGFGNQQIEGKIQQAELEKEITLAQYKQQLLKSISDGLSAYWQLYRASEIKSIRQQAVENANKTYKDLERLVKAGRSSKKDLLEAKSVIVSREAELQAVLQVVDESIIRLKTLMNISDTDSMDLSFELQDKPDDGFVQMPEDFNNYFTQVLENWPSYLIANSKIKIEQQNLLIANDDNKPKLNLNVGYATDSLSYDEQHFSDSLSNKYRRWNIGLDFSMPINGNERASSRQNIAQAKKQQAEIDLDAVKVSLANDIRTRWAQTSKSHAELIKQFGNVKLLEELLAMESMHFNKGLSRLSELYDREDKLNQAKQRLVDSLAKYELSKISLKLAEGSLLEEYDVNISYK